MAQKAEKPGPVLSSVSDEQSSGRDAMNALNAFLAEYHQISRRQIRYIACLAFAIAVLAAVMLLGLGIQIWLALLDMPD